MKLAATNLSIGIWSDNYEELARWYQDVLSFPFKSRTDLKNDTCIDFEFGENYFFIGKHDKVSGNAQDPYRIMIGFSVESISETFSELKKKNVTIIAPPFEGPTGGFWCMTIADPEGNILQFFGQK